jgi:hypothetical protein
MKMDYIMPRATAHSNPEFHFKERNLLLFAINLIAAIAF